MRDFAADEFSDMTDKLDTNESSRLCTAPRLARCVLIDSRAESIVAIAVLAFDAVEISNVLTRPVFSVWDPAASDLSAAAVPVVIVLLSENTSTATCCLRCCRPW